MIKGTLELWDEFKETPPAVTKAFSRGGGFKGKAIDPMYIVRRLTEKFGPVGDGWGWEITGEDYVTGAPFSNKYEDKKGNPIETNFDGNTIIHKVKLRLWYMKEMGGSLCKEKCFTGEQYGLTTFVGEYKSGPFTDEEHAKKSVTDAIGKCAVYLGVAADVHMGLHDDSKYVHDLREKLDKEKPKQAPKDTSKAGVDDIPLGKTTTLITEAQRGRLFKISREHDWAETAVKSLLAKHGFESSKDVTWEKYSTIIEELQHGMEGA